MPKAGFDRPFVLGGETMLIRRGTAQLLVIDMQERLLPAMAEPARVEKRCMIVLEAARAMGLPVSFSEQYPKGLGHTVAALAPAPAFAKTAFSCLGDEALAGHLKSNARSQILVCGIEAHVCVLQTAMDLLKADYDVFVVADAVASRAPPSVDLALARMRDAGAAIVNTEMVLFELLGAAGTPEFKALSALIR
jgi:nicotinamidase-related amidase